MTKRQEEDRLAVVAVVVTALDVYHKRHITVIIVFSAQA